VPEIITKQEAKARGLKYYFTGKMCKHGHVCERYTNSGDCVECVRERNRRYYETYGNQERERNQHRYWKDIEKTREYHRRWYWKDPEKRRERAINCYQEDPEKYRERSRQWYYKHREAQLKSHQRWLKENPDYKRQYDNERYANDPEYRDQQRLRTFIARVVNGTPGKGALRHVPPGRSDAIRAKIDADLAAIPDAPDNFDDLDRRDWHLDHVVPVSVMLDLLPDEPRPVLAYVATHPDMLRPLPAVENISRGNRFDEAAEAAFDRFAEIVDEARAYHGLGS